MTTEFFRGLLQAAAAYVIVGAMFAALFHRRGLRVIDAGSREAGLGFRLIITPGIVALWPLLALRWFRLARGRAFLGEQDAPVSQLALRKTHRLAWQLMAVLLPLLVGIILWSRPEDEGRPLPAGLHPVAGHESP